MNTRYLVYLLYSTHRSGHDRLETSVIVECSRAHLPTIEALAIHEARLNVEGRTYHWTVIGVRWLRSMIGEAS